MIRINRKPVFLSRRFNDKQKPSIPPPRPGCSPVSRYQGKRISGVAERRQYVLYNGFLGANQPIILDKAQVVTGTSIGIALYPDDGEDMDQLIKLADEAMYRIKKSGKNGFSFIHTA